MIDTQPVRLRDGIRFALVVFIGLRVLVSATAVITVGNVQPPSSAASQLDVPARPGWHNIVSGTDRWDAGWFERIARDGYDPADASAAFFPGYPVAIRVVTFATPLGQTGAALLASNLAFLGALIVLYALTAREYSVEIARKTVLLLACFPASFFFFAPYSESLFLLLTLLTFWWIRGRRWGAGAAAGFGAALTRSIGVLLVPALVVEAWTLAPGARRRALLAAMTPVLAPIAYSVYWLARSGDPLQPLHAQDAWFRTFQLVPVTLGHALQLGVEGIVDPRGIYWTADLLLTAIVLGPLIARWREMARTYLVYAAVTVLVVLSYPLPERPLLSVPRFLIVVFPAFWAMAALVRPRVFVVAIVTFLVGFVALSAAFMNWGFVF